jgi:hypothetical protein
MASWRRATATIKEGQRLIESGNWNLKRKPSETRDDREAVARAHELGSSQIQQGEALIKGAHAQLDALSQEVFERAQKQASLPKSWMHRIDAENDPQERLEAAARSLMETLWANGITRILLAGAYDAEATYDEALTQQLAAQMQQIDGDNYSFSLLPKDCVRWRGTRLTLKPGSTPLTGTSVILWSQNTTVAGQPVTVLQAVDPGSLELKALKIAPGSAFIGNVTGTLEDPRNFLISLRRARPSDATAVTGGEASLWGELALVQALLLESEYAVVPQQWLKSVVAANTVPKQSLANAIFALTLHEDAQHEEHHPSARNAEEENAEEESAEATESDEVFKTMEAPDPSSPIYQVEAFEAGSSHRVPVGRLHFALDTPKPELEPRQSP